MIQLYPNTWQKNYLEKLAFSNLGIYLEGDLNIATCWLMPESISVKNDQVLALLNFFGPIQFRRNSPFSLLRANLEGNKVFKRSFLRGNTEIETLGCSPRRNTAGCFLPDGVQGAFGGIGTVFFKCKSIEIWSNQVNALWSAVVDSKNHNKAKKIGTWG